MTPTTMLTTNDVQDFARHQEYKLHRSHGTVRRYQAELLTLVRAGVPLEPAALAEWVTRGAAGQALAPNTRNRRLVILRALVKFLRSEGRIENDPTEGIERARVPSPVRVALTTHDLRGLMKQLRRAPRSWRRTRDEAILLLLFHTGLRVSELRSLDLHQVDLRSHVLRAVRRKGGDDVDLQLNTEAGDALSRWLAERPPTADPAVFVGGAAVVRLTVRAIQKRLASLGRAAGLAVRVHPHALRHAHATALLRHGASTEIIRKSLHHRSLATTQRYLHADGADLRVALNRLPRIASTGPDDAPESRP